MVVKINKSKLFHTVLFGGVFMAMMLGVSTAVFAQESAGEEPEGLILGIREIPGLDEKLDIFTEKVSPIDIELGASFVSAYIWRGQNLGSDFSFQPYVTLSPDFEPEGLGDISFTYWIDYTQNEKESTGSNHKETDFSVDYALDLGKYASFSTGYIYYDFPYDGGGKSQEVYFGLGANVFLNPSLTAYIDWDRGNGEWYELGISHDIDFEVATVSTYATLGYVNNQWGAQEGFATLDFGVSLPIPVGTHMTVEPFISYTKRLQSPYPDDQGLTHDEIYGGVNYSISF